MISNLKSQILEELWSLVASIPRGKVASYGEVGRALSTPSSGYMVGRWMAQAPGGLPWWRVVGKGGEMRTAQRDPQLAEIQRQYLLEEGVGLVDDRVEMSADAHIW